MRSRGGFTAAVLLVTPVAIILSACAVSAAIPTPRPAPSETPGPPSAEPVASPSEPLTETFPYDAFADPTTIDNEWLPLIPGTQWTWEGQTVEDDEAVPHSVVMAVTDMVKVIDGITTVVVLDQDFADGQLVEAEIVFVAQDDEGNIWHLGQYPEEYEDGVFVDAPGWIAGKQNSLAGYWMTADPQVGKRSYSQGWGPAVDWTDRGRAVELGIQDCVAFGCYDDVLVIEEWALDQPLARQLKFYGRGVGNIRVDWSGNANQEQETLELVEYRTLDPDELAEVRQHALDLEARAYEIRSEIYGDTEPMSPRQ
jgi:hypothetical protein